MLYLIERVPPWTKTIYDRVGKKEKLYMTDTGMLGHLLNWNKEKIHLDAMASGLLIETFVFTQLAALIDAQSESYQLFHYRDKDKREIDFIIENSDGDMVGIEVKAGSSVSKDSFKHLYWFKNKLAHNKPFKGIVLYTGEHALSFGDGFWALPISSLWKV
jgi:predicted AAA+ superfamily ATPase